METSFRSLLIQGEGQVISESRFQVVFLIFLFALNEFFSQIQRTS